MGRRCCVVGCSSTTRLQEHHGVTYHSFPLDATIRSIWIRNTRLNADRQITKSVLVCSRHFRRIDFQPQRSGKYLLKPRVFPTVFPWGRVENAQIEADLETLKNAALMLTTTQPQTPPLDEATKASVEATVAIILKETATLNAAAEDKEKEKEKEIAAASPTPTSTSKFEAVTNFNSGARLEAQDFDGNWHVARVVEVDNDEREVLIKFEKTGKSKSAVVGSEEWIPMNSTRLRQKVQTKPVPIFELEEKVLARWSGPRKFPGTIKKVLGNDAYEVLFDDGYVKNVRAVHMVKVMSAEAEQATIKAAQMLTSTKSAGNLSPRNREQIISALLSVKQSSLTAQVKTWPLLDLSKLDVSKLNLPEIPHDGEWTCHWVNDQPIGRKGCLVVGDHRKPTVVVEDWRLPEGWVKHMYQRSNLLGKWDVILVSPNGKRFRSKADLKLFLEEKGEVYNPDVYDFSIHRRRAKDINAYVFTPDYTPQQTPKSKSADNSEDNVALMSTTLGANVPAQFIETPTAGSVPPVELLNASGTDKPELTDKLTNVLKNATGTSSPDNSNPNTHIEDGYAYVGGLKVQIVDNLFRCPEVGCSKNFRKENHLQIHIKHYHNNLIKLLGACPKMQELAEKRTHTLPDPNEPQPKNQISNQEFFAKMHKQDMQQSRINRKNNLTDTLDMSAEKAEHKTEAMDTGSPNVLHSTLLDTTNNTTTDNSSVMEQTLSTSATLDMSSTESKRARLSPTKRVSGARKSSRQRTTRRYLTAAQATGNTILAPPPRADFGVKDFDETQHTFNASTDAKVLDSKKRKSAGATATTTSSVDSPNATASTQKVAATRADAASAATKQNEYIKENGELIKIVRMRQEEIINCLCGYGEEDGLMIQCELCLCWQHGICNGIDKESDVPDKYVCYICRNPQGARESMLYVHDQDWLYDGKLPVANYHTANPNVQKRFDFLKKTHTLSGNLIELKRFLHSLMVKTNVASNRCHPKLYLWAKKWDDIKLDKDVKKESEENDVKLAAETNGNAEAAAAAANVPNIPQPEAAIDTTECQQRLLEHIKVQQDIVMSRLDSIENEIEKLEAQEKIIDAKNVDVDKTKDMIAAFLKDIDVVKQISKINGLVHAKKAFTQMNAP